MQNEKSIAEQICSLASEPKSDNADLTDLPLLSPSDLDFLPTETIAEGAVKAAPPPPPDSLKTTPLPSTRPHPSPIKQSHKKQKTTFCVQESLRRQRKNEEAANRYSFTRNPRFQLNLNYLSKREYNQCHIVFWDPSRQEFTLEHPILVYQRIVVPLRGISAFI